MVQMITFRNSGRVALVDDEDYELVMESPTMWRVKARQRKYGSPVFYAWRSHIASKGVVRARLAHQAMHRLILDAPADLFVDHINGNGLDNRRCNLRLCTNSQNQQNRRAPKHAPLSEFKGVTWHRSAAKWQAQIKLHGRNIYLGLYESEIEAARAYASAAERHFGEFAFTNLEAA